MSSLHGNGVATKEASCRLYHDSQGIEGGDGCSEEVGGNLAAMTRFPFFRIFFWFFVVVFIGGGGGGGGGWGANI